MIRLCAIILLGITLSSCANKPPVQAMAEARAAVQSVRPLYSDDSGQNTVARHYYQSAEQSLQEAVKALDEKQYELATQKAREAKRQARLAAKLK